MKVCEKTLSLSPLNVIGNFYESKTFDPEFELIYSKLTTEVILRIFFSFKANYYEIQTSKSNSNKELIVTGKKLKYEPSTKTFSKFVLQNTVFIGNFEKKFKIIEQNSKMNGFIKKKTEWTSEYFEIILELIS